MQRAFTLLELLIVIAVIMILAAIMFPSVNRAGPNARRSSCQSNLKQIGLGFLQYAQDCDERLPPARTISTVGWADAVQPYMKSEQLFQCPSAPDTRPSSFLIDYFYNRRLARVLQQKVPSPQLTIMAGEGNDNAPTWSSWMGLPPDAATNPTSPARRHMNTGNYLFADGHVKSFKPTAVSSTFTTPTSRPTFAIK